MLTDSRESSYGAATASKLLKGFLINSGYIKQENTVFKDPVRITLFRVITLAGQEVADA